MSRIRRPVPDGATAATGWLLALTFALTPAPSAAQDPPAPPEPAADDSRDGEATGEPSRAEVLLGWKRPVPDLDGRQETEPSLGEMLLFIPRTLLLPLHLFFEYVLRRPFGLLLTEMERNGLGAIFDFLLFDEQRAGVVPVVLVDFDFQPSGGLHYFHNELGSDRNAFQLWASTGGRSWWRVTAQDRLYLDRAERRRLRFTVDAWRRPDYLFHGLGPGTRFGDRSRYERTFANGSIAFRQGFWRSSSLVWTVKGSFNRFADGDFGDDPGIREAVAQGRYPLPPAFDEGYTALTQQIRLSIDSRRPWPASGSGYVLTGWGAQGFDAEDLERSWFRFGGLVAGFHDVGDRHVVGAAVQAEQVVTAGREDVPFTELVFLGTSPVLLGGFAPGRLIGETSLVGAVEYSYPIWPLLDAMLVVSVGNVFDEAWAGFSFRALRASFGIGTKTSDNPDQAFTLQLAVGTETFAEGAGFDSFRLYVGLSQL